MKSGGPRNYWPIERGGRNVLQPEPTAGETGILAAEEVFGKPNRAKNTRMPPIEAPTLPTALHF